MRNYVSIPRVLSATLFFCVAGTINSYAAGIGGGSIKLNSSNKNTISHSAKVAEFHNLQPQIGYEIFAPKAHTLNTSFDYTVWDKALGNRVIVLGPSLRRFAKPPRAEIGTRLVKRSQSSKYRLEGSRVTFFSFKDGFVDLLSEYKEDLVRLAHVHDIQSFSRDEQLAFWINLHNVILIETIAKEHPTRRPSTLTFGPDNAPLHEAKLITIKNVPLSLKNIRENIVYENWDDPNVIYGFFRGDIGGPGLMNFAVTAKNVKYVLDGNGYEYVTSLRGFQTDSLYRKVSTIYQEAAPYYFPNWPEDIESHIKGYLKDHKALSEIVQDKSIKFIKYDTTIADLWGGDKSFQAGPVFNPGRPVGVPPIAFELADKHEELKRKGLLKRRRTVIIEDVETEDK